MPDKELLLVLIVREAGPRSALAAKVAMAGVSAITAGALDDPQLDRLRMPAVLIIDSALVGASEIDQLLADPRWRRVILLGETAGEGTPPSVERMSAARAVSELPDLLARLRG